jgi:HlyD family secretion protein
MKRGHLGILLLGLLVAAGLVYGLLPRPMAVDVSVAGKGPMTVDVEEEGVTRVMHRYVITAPTAGYARRITLKVGDPVEKAQVLAVLEPARADALDPRRRAQARAQVSAAEAKLAVARENARAAAAEAKLARQELQRDEKLGRAHFLSQSAMDQAHTHVSSSQAALRAAEHQVHVAGFELDAARAALAHGEALQTGQDAETVDVRAPVSAKVLKVEHESEGPVQAGQPLLEIGDPEALEVDVELLSTAAVKIAPKSPVIINHWGGDQPLQGVVRTVEPTGFTKVSALGVEEQRVHIVVDFTSPRRLWQRLGDGYRVEVRFVVWQGHDVLQVPASALFRHNGGWAVFVARNGRARLQPVKVGHRNGLTAEVLEGVRAGESVITHPDDRIQDGRRVRPRHTGT